MIFRIQKDPERSFLKNVSFMFVLYWGILVLWQNISGAELRGTTDLIIKIGLLLYFLGFYLRNATTVSKSVIWVVLLALLLLIPAATESSFTLSNVIYYIYPILVLLMVYGLGNRLEINRRQLVCFCNCVIGIVLYAAFYALIFYWDQFEGALSLTNAYGNELCSFFVSNFEYGMYLAAAIVSCLLCLSLNQNMSIRRKVFYCFAIIVLTLNLILTFSRSTIIALILIIVCYGIISSKKSRKWLLLVAAFIVLVLATSSTISNFVRDIVFKENNMSGRDILFEQGLQYFRNGSWWQQLFGFGIYETRLYFDTNYEHGSLHNAYLQVLLYFGYVGCGSMIWFMLSQLIANFKLIRKDRKMGGALLGITAGAMLIMVTTTAIVFTSPIDSFFLTMFFVLVPKYVRNSIRNGKFYNSSNVDEKT